MTVDTIAGTSVDVNEEGFLTTRPSGTRTWPSSSPDGRGSTP